MTLIQLENVTLSYDGHIAVQNASFTVQSGDYIAVVGENGSGKSTLIKAMAGLIRPSGGTLLRSGLRRGELGYMPQSTAVQKDFPATVEEVVYSGLLPHKGFSPFYSKAQKELALQNMELLHVAHLRKKSFRDLSGGQQHRALIARALCATKKLLLLDEPAFVLDPMVTHELYDLLRQLNTERGIAIVMVSHDIHCAIEQSKKILHMHKNVLYFGDTAAYRQTELCRCMIGSCHGHGTLPEGASL